MVSNMRNGCGSGRRRQRQRYQGTAACRSALLQALARLKHPSDANGRPRARSVPARTPQVSLACCSVRACAHPNTRAVAKMWRAAEVRMVPSSASSALYLVLRGCGRLCRGFNAMYGKVDAELQSTCRAQPLTGRPGPPRHSTCAGMRRVHACHLFTR